MNFRDSIDGCCYREFVGKSMLPGYLKQDKSFSLRAFLALRKHSVLRVKIFQLLAKESCKSNELSVSHSNSSNHDKCFPQASWQIKGASGSQMMFLAPCDVINFFGERKLWLSVSCSKGKTIVVQDGFSLCLLRLLLLS